MGIQLSLGRRVATVAVLFCVVALSACSEAVKGTNDNPLAMGGTGAVGGAGGAGGAGGTAGVAGMVSNPPAGGMGGTAGDVAGGTGGVAGMVSGGGGGVGGMMPGGMGGMPGGMGGMTGGTGSTMEWEEKGMGDGSDVVTIGDSWMRLNPTNGIEQSLEKVSGRDYRNYAVPGTMVLDGRIPSQLDDAIAENPNIKTLIMTGGGNDILLGNIFCTVAWEESCNETVHEVAAALAALREKMADAGIEDVVILSYDYIPNQVVKPGLDLSVMLSNEMCTPDAMPRCHFLNNLNTVSGMISGDGIHPTAAGYDILGQRVWDLLQERKLRR